MNVFLLCIKINPHPIPYVCHNPKMSSNDWTAGFFSNAGTSGGTVAGSPTSADARGIARSLCGSSC